MRVIARRRRQSLVIGEDIKVEVLEVFDDHVRLGITCDRFDPPYFEQDLYVAPGAEPELTWSLLGGRRW